VISIKKYLELDSSELSKNRPTDAEELLATTLEAYRSGLLAMGDSGVRACPTLGPELRRNLLRLAESLAKVETPSHIHETEAQAETLLHQWGEGTAGYFQQRAGDVKEILMVLANAAASVAERDQRYAHQFGEFTKRLHALAKLEDLPMLRSAIVRGAEELKSCVDSMKQDGRESVIALRRQVVTYQSKLEDAEQRATHDSLTGLVNRHGVESKLQFRIAAGKPFCVVMLDLNGFKTVNDTFGHEAGDDLLKQFSAELRSASRASDVVGRWGGDEFVVILDANQLEAQTHVERLQRWVFGRYTLRLPSGDPNVEMSAALGLVEWKPGEGCKEVLARADALMYQQKTALRDLGKRSN
jgi:diguanylate cyclase (GGDEF)-like protein